MEKPQISQLPIEERILILDVFGKKNRHCMSSCDIERDARVDSKTLNKLIEKKIVEVSQSKKSNFYLFGRSIRENKLNLISIPRPSYYLLSPEASQFVYSKQKMKKVS